MNSIGDEYQGKSISEVEQPYSSVVLSFPYLQHLITCPYTAASICYQDLCPASTQLELLNQYSTVQANYTMARGIVA